MAKKKKKIGVLTGGGDCPGLNAVIRGVVKASISHHDMEVIGFEDGYQGLVEKSSFPMDWRSVSGILTQGGTILGTSNVANPFHWPHKNAKGKLTFIDCSDKVVDYVEEIGLDTLLVLSITFPLFLLIVEFLIYSKK